MPTASSGGHSWPPKTRTTGREMSTHTCRYCGKPINSPPADQDVVVRAVPQPPSAKAGTPCRRHIFFDLRCKQADGGGDDPRRAFRVSLTTAFALGGPNAGAVLRARPASAEPLEAYPVATRLCLPASDPSARVPPWRRTGSGRGSGTYPRPARGADQPRLFVFRARP